MWRSAEPKGERRSGISRTIIAGALVVVVVAAALAFYATASAPVPSTKSTPPSTSTAPVQIAAPVGVGSNQSLNFTPSTIRVVIGVNSTIVFANHDSTEHDVASTSVPSGANPFDSGGLAPGATFTVTLTVAGTYQYHCTIHPAWMRGMITVVQP